MWRRAGHDARSADCRIGDGGSVTRKAAPPSSPSTSAMSPPDRSAFFFAIDRPSPMPCFLNVIVGSNSVPDAAALSPGPESCTSIATWPSATS